MARDEDDVVEDVIAQLRGALGDIDVGGLRDALKEGLQRAFDALEPRDDTAETPSNVVQLDRGDLDELDEGTDEAAFGAVSVRVLRPGLDDGVVRVEDGEQPLYVGREPMAYRVVVDVGALDLVADGQLVGTLRAGQSVDVHAERLVARGTGVGRYRCLDL